MSYETQRPQGATQAALEKPTPDEVERARNEFYDTFEAHCRTDLSPDAQRRLGETFAMTVVHGLHRKPGWWRQYREFALRHVASIGERARRGATGGIVTRSVLITHADAVVRSGAAECEALLRAKSGDKAIRVFCEDYVFDVDATEAAAAETGQRADAAAADHPQIEQAWRDFQIRFYGACEGGPGLGDDVPDALLRLFDLTVRDAIENRGHDWVRDVPATRFALNRVHDIAVVAMYAAGEDEVTGEMVRRAADQVVAYWRPRCRNRVTEHGRKVFCEVYA